MRKLLVLIAGALILGALLFYVLTIPRRIDPTILPATASPVRGERIFWAGGCASCHAAPAAKGKDRLKLPGGAPLKTAFGTFQAPNISPHPTDGIGGWSLVDFANAMQRGVDPAGRHLYPAFPYTSYIRMTPTDIADLYAYLQTLPKVAGKAPPNSLSFPFNIRRGIGLWKLAFLNDTAEITLAANATPAARAGQYLVEGPGHCGQCHTPRTLRGLGGLNTARWLAGAPNLEGPKNASRGRTPNVTPHASGIGAWSASEISEYLETGFTPDYDSVGGTMVEVQANMAHLTPADRSAIAAYLKAIPPQPGDASP